MAYGGHAGTPWRLRPDSAASDSECGQATHDLAAEASRWGAAVVNFERAWETPDGDTLLKQEIASDCDLEAGHLAELLGRQLSECSDVIAVTDDVTVESQMRACDLSRGDAGVRIVQSWTASNGGAGSTRLAYIVHGHNLVVLPFASADPRGWCEHAVFDRVVAAAAAKVARRTSEPPNFAQAVVLDDVHVGRVGEVIAGDEVGEDPSASAISRPGSGPVTSLR